ncbi:MAG TPA: OmpA family protein [Polyangiaceae bacterium]|jgi:chemotaxis protein MotB|nr:OmpA family protein [Polyangiaceae bacterium]
MGRKAKHEEHVNHERWLVSYADFITLLFAFFVVMFAVSQVDSSKMGRFAESVRVATHLGPFEEPGSPVPSLSGEQSGAGSTNLSVHDRTDAKGFFTALRQELESRLKESMADGRSKLIEVPEGLVIRLKDAAFFNSGAAILRIENAKDLEAVAEVVRDANVPIRIEGHTDSAPIKNRIYRSNWDLSGARAASVLEFLTARGVPEDRLCIAGYADRRPIADNGTDEGRQQNRRVDIVLIRPELIRDAHAPTAKQKP